MKLHSDLSVRAVEKASYFIPDWMKAFRTDLEQEITGDEENEGIRQSWESDRGYLAATIFSAVGIGNIWRFPYLTYKHGGAIFFVPYLLCLVFLAVPLMIMELGLGQKI